MSTAKMKVEIWSDIMCPFCYIGKRHFESALQQFPDSDKIEIEWKSFQLDPTIPENLPEGTTAYSYLAERKGMSLEQSKQMHQNVIQMAKNAGLNYNFDTAVVANSFKAHQLIQVAKSKNLGDAAEERLFKAYFIEGKNFGSEPVLLELGKEIGLTETDLIDLFTNPAYKDRVNKDIAEARNIGVTGVPFFVFDRKYAVSGAQPAESFVQALEQSLGEWKESNPQKLQNLSEGESCDVDGNCD
jgi:protein disulfide-isomerase